MTQRSRGWRWARVGAVVAGAMAAVLVGGPAMAADVTGVAGGRDNDAGKFTDEAKTTHDPDRIFITIGGQKTDAYCIDAGHWLGVGDTYTETSWQNAGVQNLNEIRWVLTHGYHSSPTGNAAEVAAAAGVTVESEKLEDLAYAGTQAAIWHFSDGIKLPEAEIAGNEGVVRKIYHYLVNKATEAGKTSEPAPTLKITPDKGTGTAGSLSGPYTVEAADGEVTLTATGGKVVDQAGKPITSVKAGGKFWVSADDAAEVKVTAAGTVEVPVGRVFVFEKKQKIILAGSAKANVSTELKVTFSSAPLLPVTGASTAIIAGVGLALLAAGFLAVTTLRRRRVRFTAA